MGVALLAAAPATGLQMGAWKWGWGGARMCEEGHKATGTVLHLEPLIHLEGLAVAFYVADLVSPFPPSFSFFLWSLHL